MKYRNARDVFPPELLRQLQQYAGGEAVYIPRPAARRPWGSANGSREELARRNERMRREKREGATIEELAQRYYLACDTVRRIVYGKG